MSWTDFYRRRDALNAVLEHARRNPASPLPHAEVPGVPEVFATPDALLLALHYKWTLALTGRLNVALIEDGRDPVDAVAAAWRTTAEEHPVLRRLLDENEVTHAEALRPALEAEHRLLALFRDAPERRLVPSA